MTRPSEPLSSFHAAVQEWFGASFAEPTRAQRAGWPPIVAGRSTLLLAPTGSGKTLAAFLAAIDRLMFSPEPGKAERCRVLYVSPLKALAVDVEKNLQAPLSGIAAVARQRGMPFRLPAVAIRSGDTPAADRARLARSPADILITTPESLYLMLTSAARSTLGFVDTVIVDEIHAVAGGKRGSHLFLSLERLEELRAKDRPPLQRIGLSATQRPLEEIARLLGGGEISGGKRARWKPRPVEVVDAGGPKRFELSVEVPLEDMSQPGSAGADRSIWPSIHPRLVELIRRHRATMVFVNSRRLAERLAAAINETAGEEIAQAHHGSIAREKRLEIEQRLKRGELPAIVATSSLELGIDMGSVDLVIQIEAPPSVATGMQRIGRAGHTVGEVSRGILFPKYRGDLLACAAVTARMVEGKVEETAYPRNPLDVLAQQVVAITAMDSLRADGLYRLVRRAAPFADLPRSSFDGVLDLLSGRYPSDEFAALRPRITWNRARGTLKAREGARRVAVVNGGTIPDRGLYGVFLSGGDTRSSRRVGELDEEMVFESQPGDVFLLGASSWRIEEITHDRVLVRPAPGEPGRMPFWHGDRPGRPAEFGRAIGALARELSELSEAEAERRLRERHGLDERAASNLVAYLREQSEATGEVPSDRVIVVERYQDEVGDWRVCVLSPFGARVHAPWAVAVRARLAEATGFSVEMLWSDDGIVFRLPEADAPPETSLFLPPAEEVEDLVARSLGESSLFAARFRENAARALLLPRRHPGRRSPLWAQRKRAADLLSVAAGYGSFPILLETYRECLRDVFDLPGLVDLLGRVATRRVRVLSVDSRTPSPFAASLVFSYVGSFIYDGDAPLAERRAQALSVDPAQLKELLGEAELRELLDPDAIEEIERSLQRLGAERPAASGDAVHDLLLSVGDLTEEEIARRAGGPGPGRRAIESLQSEGRTIAVTIAGERRYAAAEDAGRLRDALGVALPSAVPAPLLEPVADPLADLVSRYARTHGPFRAEAVAGRLGIGIAPVREALSRLASAGRVVEGEFLPGGRFREWCDVQVLRAIKRRSLARLRREAEPVEPAAFGRFLVEWQSVGRPRRGPDALRETVEQLRGCAMAASALESEILPARVDDYRSGDLDRLCAAGEVVWRGIEPLTDNDGRVALYLAGTDMRLAPVPREAPGETAGRIRELLARRGALFFSDIARQMQGFSGDIVAALWTMVWAGELTNDTLAPLRSYLARASRRGTRGTRKASLRTSIAGPPGSEGRWSLVPTGDARASETERRMELVRALLDRQGVLTREGLRSEGIPAGFGAAYPVLKALEERGRVRRGYFVAGLGATQFALPGAEERLRALRQAPEEPKTLILAATDPANPYGAALPWPEREGARPQRAAGAQVILVDGALAAFFGRAERNLLTFPPEEEPRRERTLSAVARALGDSVESGKRRALLVSEVDGEAAVRSPLAPYLARTGFESGSRGYLKRSSPRSSHRSRERLALGRQEAFSR